MLLHLKPKAKPLIQSTNTYVATSMCKWVPGTIVGTGDTAGNETDTVSAIRGLAFPWGSWGDAESK